MKNKIIVVLAAIVVAIVFVVIINYLPKNNEETDIYVYEENVIDKEESENADIFGKYYEKAKNKLDTLTLDEKIGQLLLVRYPDQNAIELLHKYKFCGYIFYAKDFKDKTKDEVISMISSLQLSSSIPLLIAVDEEGGSVVRVSSNTNLATEKFKSPSELYSLGGFEKVFQDTINKSNLLNELGINLNLAPVVDVTTNPENYMYKRALGKNTLLTAEYAKTVIEASKIGKVSYTLKHFPGYADNIDTHTESSTDVRTYEDILNNDLPPFISGIEAGAEAILVSHNIVSSIDDENEASLSLKVHEILRNNLMFTGVIITDDLDMGAVSQVENSTIKAVLAGNNIIITTDYIKSIEELKTAILSGIITEEKIDELVLLNLAWKYYKKIM